MNVTMLIKTAFGGKKLNAGDVAAVDKEIAERWIGNGLAAAFDGEAKANDDSQDDFPPMLLPIDQLETLPPEQLKNYAEAHKVDIGRATTPGGIIEKIVEAGKIYIKPFGEV